MALEAVTVAMRIVKDGGAITSDTYVGDGSSTWKRGAILKVSNGTVVAAPAGAFDTDFTGTSGARLVIAASDQSVATSGFVSVQEIEDETILQAQLGASDTGSPVCAQSLIGDNYAGKLMASGIIYVNVDNTTKPCFKVVDVATNFDPHNPTSDDNYGFVYVKILSSILG